MSESSIHDQPSSHQDQDQDHERRGGDRQPLAGNVVVRFDDVPLVGSGQNTSPEGVFFVADGAVRVRVQVAGQDPVVGEVVRMTSMGNGKTGIAVVFPDAGS